MIVVFNWKSHVKTSSTLHLSIDRTVHFTSFFDPNGYISHSHSHTNYLNLCLQRSISYKHTLSISWIEYGIIFSFSGYSWTCSQKIIKRIAEEVRSSGRLWFSRQRACPTSLHQKKKTNHQNPIWEQQQCVGWEKMASSSHQSTRYQRSSQ